MTAREGVMACEALGLNKEELQKVSEGGGAAREGGGLSVSMGGGRRWGGEGLR